MGTVTHHGWRTSSDEIPQPTGVIMGRNLRKPKQLSAVATLMTDIKAILRRAESGPRRWRSPQADSQARDRDLNRATMPR
jgi:hypothetical protein